MECEDCAESRDGEPGGSCCGQCLDEEHIIEVEPPGPRRALVREADALADRLELNGALELLKQRDTRIAELESIRDAEREVHIREIEAWERVHRAMIDERDAARERVAELEAALDGVVTELGGPGYFWIIKDKAIQRAKDALAKGKK
jgi:hypothetical protein